MSVRARELAKERRKEREAAEARQRRQRRGLLAGGGVIIAGLLVAIVISLVNAAGGTGSPAAAPTPTGPVVTPAAATSNGALTLGRATAPVRLEVFFDYMCPFCGRFEAANSTEVERLVADGTVRLELHPLAFLDRMSEGSRYSTRTANAIATVADRAPEKLLAFHRALYANQPQEGTAGLSDEGIATLATGAGVPPEVVRAFAENTFEPWVAASTEAAFASGVTGTPTVRINGSPFKGDLYTAGPLTEAIMSAKAG